MRASNISKKLEVGSLGSARSVREVVRDAEGCAAVRRPRDHQNPGGGNTASARGNAASAGLALATELRGGCDRSDEHCRLDGLGDVRLKAGF